MRKYEGLWIQLKTTGTVTVAANPKLHARLKKAVTKEKYNDIAYKISWDLQGTEQPVLEVRNDKDAHGKKIDNVLVFKLVKPVLLGEL